MRLERKNHETNPIARFPFGPVPRLWGPAHPRRRWHPGGRHESRSRYSHRRSPARQPDTRACHARGGSTADGAGHGVGRSDRRHLDGIAAAESLPAEEIVPDLANQAVLALKNRDMPAVAALVHPISGLRFTPYAYVQPSDLVFPTDQLPGLFEDPTAYHWGAYDGTGEPIDLTFAQYYEDFVYDQDYAQAEEVGYNERLGTGNSIDNSQEFYSGAFVVEYYFSGFDPQYAGMDWRSLRLVFQQHEGTWYLVGIIHDEWTI